MGTEINLNEMDTLPIQNVIDNLSSSYIKLIKEKIDFKMFPSVMLWGQPGVGKSQAIRQIAKNIEEKTVIVLDPMLATGGSAAAAITMIKKRGAQDIRYIGLVGAPEGVERLRGEHPDVDIYLAALDEKLNENCYIVPGLGDCGDRLFGTK